jgi:D-alanyl-D-alanine carboxypeptidase
MKTIKILGLVLAGFVLFMGGVGVYAYYKYFNIEGDFVADFMRKNPEKSALYWMRNDTLVAEHRADVKMPLASTVKILVATEFAKQVSSGKCNPEERVPLSEPGRFYLEGTDGGAHPAWLADLAKQGRDSARTATLLDIAKGMIRYSSNANTEYLMWRLGLPNINANLSTLALTPHDSLYPFTSALYVCSDERSSKGLKLMPWKLYMERTYRYHELLKMDTTVKATFKIAHVNMPVQRVWSDRLPGSSARVYGRLMQQIQNRTLLDSAAQATLETLLEWPMEAFDSNRERFVHLGAKGGSTAFVLTYALYAEDKAGNKTQLVFLFNDLSPVESTLLQSYLADFQLRVLSADPEDRQGILTTLQKKNT